MRLLRYGAPGRERPGLLDDEGRFAPREGDNFRTELCRLHAPRQPLEKRKVEDLFQVVHELGRARLRQVHGIGCAVEVPMLIERNEQSEMPDAEATKEMRVRRHRGGECSDYR